MANEITVDLTQNEPNTLTAIADVERSKLIPKNDLFWMCIIQMQVPSQM